MTRNLEIEAANPARGRRIVAQASISIAIGLVLMGIFVGWLALDKFEDTLSKNLRQRLEGYAQMASMRYDARDLQGLMGGVEDFNPEDLIEFQWAQSMTQMLGVRRIVIFAEKGRVLVDSQDAYASGRIDHRLGNHDTEIQKAILDNSPVTTVRFPRTIAGKEVLSQMSFQALPDTTQGEGPRLVAGVELPNDFQADVDEMTRIIWLWVGIFIAITGAVTFTVILIFSRLMARTDELRRKAELADFSGAIAHEIKNPLAAMLTGLQLLQRSLGEKERKIGDKLEREIHVLDRIVKDFLAFARGAERNPSQITMGEIVARVRQQLTEDQDRSLELDGDANIELFVDPVALAQALGNLVKNAAQASLDVSHSSGREAKVIVRYRVSNGRLLIDVIDSGAGVSESIRGRLFSPFVSGRSEGTGLGLAIVRRLVEDMRGEVSLRQSSDNGAHFVLTVPAKAEIEEMSK